MNLRKRIILNRVICAVLAAAAIIYGCFGNEMFFSMGIALAAITVVQFFRFLPLLKDDGKLQDAQRTMSDERVLFIAQKSYSSAYWISIYAEFAALIVCMIMKLTSYSAFLGYIMCFQLIIYVVMRSIYNKKF